MKKYNNAEFNINNVGQNVELYGWVQKKRDLGGLVFVDLRDRSGIIQLIIRPENKYYDVATSLKTESVIRAVGTINERENKNPKLPTGEIEVIVDELELINQSIDIPFEISDNTTALEDTRLKYRFLDLRRESLKNNLILREHKDFLEEILESEPEVPGFLYQFNEENIKLGESLLKEYEEGKIGFEKVQRKKIGKWKILWKNLTLSI